MEMSVFFRYFMVLIQEMDLKLDLGFLYAILDLFTPENASIVSSEQEVRNTHIHTVNTHTLTFDSLSFIHVPVYVCYSSRWNCSRRT